MLRHAAADRDFARGGALVRVPVSGVPAADADGGVHRDFRNRECVLQRTARHVEGCRALGHLAGDRCGRGIRRLLYAPEPGQRWRPSRPEAVVRHKLSCYQKGKTHPADGSAPLYFFT